MLVTFHTKSQPAATLPFKATTEKKETLSTLLTEPNCEHKTKLEKKYLRNIRIDRYSIKNIYSKNNVYFSFYFKQFNTHV